MSILSSIKSATSKVGSTLKSTFAPSAEVAAQRRQDVFGTTSKPIVTAAIVTGAAATGLGGAAVRAVTPTLTKAAPVVVEAAKSLIPKSVGGKVAAAVAAPAVISALAANPSIPVSVVKSSAEIGTNIGEFTAEPSKEKALDIIKDNPVAATLLGVAGAGLITRAAGGIPGAIIAKELLDEAPPISQQPKTDDNLIKEGDKSTSKGGKSDDTGVILTEGGGIATMPSTNIGGLPVPKTAQTQALTTKRKKKKVSRPQNISQRVNLNIFNTNKNQRYLNYHTLMGA